MCSFLMQLEIDVLFPNAVVNRSSIQKETYTDPIRQNSVPLNAHSLEQDEKDN